MGWVYLICLCLEIYIILKLKAYSTYKQRLLAYHIFAFLVAGLLIIIFIETESLGISELGTCLIRHNSIGEKLDIAVSIVILALIWTSYFMIKKQLGCCYGPAFHHLSKVVLAVSISGFVSRLLTALLYIQRTSDSQGSSYTVLIGSIATLIWGISVAVTRLLHPKVLAKIKEVCGKPQESPEYLIEADKEKEEILKSILQMTLDGAADDIADMFEHLGHKILVQILVLLTLRFREDKEKELGLDEALKEFRGTTQHKHYSVSLYTDLAAELRLPFVDQIYCPDVSLIEFERGIFRCIMRMAGISKEDVLE